jgi:hypothetical protein
MKQLKVLPLFRILIVFTCFLSLSTIVHGQTNSNGGKGANTAIRQMAEAGDTVWIIVNHVKPDKREQFEKFVHEIFWPMASKLSTEEQKVFRQTRILHPTGPEEDGTYSYLFIMDPLIIGGNYDIASLLKKQYGEQKAMEYGKMFDETQEREQTQFKFIQSKH